MEHGAAKCRSKRTCQICKGKHHPTLCKESSTMMVVTVGLVVYPLVVVKVNNIICIALLDTGNGHSYAFSGFLEKLNIQSVRKESKALNDDVINSYKHASSQNERF